MPLKARVDLVVAYGALRCQDGFQLGLLLNPTRCISSPGQPQAAPPAHPVLTADGCLSKQTIEPMFSTTQTDRQKTPLGHHQCVPKIQMSSTDDSTGHRCLRVSIPLAYGLICCVFPELEGESLGATTHYRVFNSNTVNRTNRRSWGGSWG